MLKNYFYQSKKLFIFIENKFKLKKLMFILIIVIKDQMLN